MDELKNIFRSIDFLDASIKGVEKQFNCLRYQEQF